MPIGFYHVFLFLDAIQTDDVIEQVGTAISDSLALTVEDCSEDFSHVNATEACRNRDSVDEIRKTNVNQSKSSLDEVISDTVGEIHLEGGMELRESSSTDRYEMNGNVDTEVVLAELRKEETNPIQQEDDVSEEESVLLHSGERSTHLESVTEETEEQLNEEVGRKSPNLHKSNTSANLDLIETAVHDKTIAQLPPLPTIRRVGILKKRDRPLSDSFVSLKREDCKTLEFLGNPGKSSLTKCHSLDSLRDGVNDEESPLSQPSSRSQLSLTEIHDSGDSFSDSDSPKSRSRCDSDKLSFSSQRASSLLSLDERCSHPSLSSQEDISRGPKKPSLFSKISFKKAKSMTSLEMKDRRKLSDEGKLKICC